MKHRKIGRPKGSRNKEPGFSNWQPKEWKLDYETVLLLYISGKSQKEISDVTGFHEVHVGNILRCDLARQRIDMIRVNIGIKSEDNIKYIVEKAMDRLKNFIENDEVFKNSPIMAIDRAMRTMEMLNSSMRVKDPDSKTINNTLILATQSSVDRLLKAAELSNMVNQIQVDAKLTDNNPLNNNGRALLPADRS